MADLPLAAASRRLRGVLVPTPREDPAPDELNVLPLIRHASTADDEEAQKFIEFSRCFSFSGADAKSLISPLVYVLLRGNRPLYVGMSSRGARRPFDPAHHVLCYMEDEDKLLIWPMQSVAMAERMERLLITHLKPTLNKQNVTREAREALGLTKWQVKA